MDLWESERMGVSGNMDARNGQLQRNEAHHQDYSLIYHYVHAHMHHCFFSILSADDHIVPVTVIFDVLCHFHTWDTIINSKQDPPKKSSTLPDTQASVPVMVTGQQTAPPPPWQVV